MPNLIIKKENIKILQIACTGVSDTSEEITVGLGK